MHVYTQVYMHAYTHVYTQAQIWTRIIKFSLPLDGVAIFARVLHCGLTVIVPCNDARKNHVVD